MVRRLRFAWVLAGSFSAASVHAETHYRVPADQSRESFAMPLPTRGTKYADEERPLSVAGPHLALEVATWPRERKQQAPWSIIPFPRPSVPLPEVLARSLRLPIERFDQALWYAPLLSWNRQYVAFVTDAEPFTGVRGAEPALFRFGFNTRRLELVSATGQPDGTAKRLPGRVRRPSISHSGRLLAFQVVQGAASNVYLRDMAELGARPVCPADAHCENPVLSADGKRLAFVTRAALSPSDTDRLPDVYMTPVTSFTPELVSVRSSGDAKKRAVQKIADEPLAISMDGSSIAFSGDDSVWLFRAGKLISMSPLFGGIRASQPAMDQGRNLVFVGRRPGEQQRRLFVYSLVTGKVQSPDAGFPRTEPEDVYYPALSPTSDALFMVVCFEAPLKHGGKPSLRCEHHRHQFWNAHPNAETHPVNRWQDPPLVPKP